MTVSEENNKSLLKSFEIKGLFNSQDVYLEFDKNAIILIGDNGLGKTTILNALYYAVSCTFHKLASIDFESITIEFKSGNKVTLQKSNLEFSNFPDDSKYIPSILRRLPLQERQQLQLLAATADRQALSKYVDFVSESYLISPSRRAEIKNFYISNTNVFDNHLNEVKKIIKQNIINEEILYFPTYRRIEEDLKNLGYQPISEEYRQEMYIEPTSLNSKQLIQFGMDDVIKKLNSLTSKINKEVKNSVSEVTNGMLSQLLSEIQITDEMKESIKKSEALNIVLNRVGDKLQEKNKEKIIKLVQSESFYTNKQNNVLIYLLSKLISVHEQQRKNDNSIRKFVDVCNSYLQKKSIVYDEDTIEVGILQANKVEDIKFLSNLSSGEKQIVSLFANIYLDCSSNFILFFDEPELSLSLEWQRRLLPDILRSGRCNFLLAVTHSPFIFDNELDENALNLKSFIQEK